MPRPRFVYTLASYWQRWRSGQLSLEDRNMIRAVFLVAGVIHLFAALLFRLLRVAAD